MPLCVSMVDYTNGPGSLPLSVNSPQCWGHFLVSGLILFLVLVLANGVLAAEVPVESWAHL